MNEESSQCHHKPMPPQTTQLAPNEPAVRVNTLELTIDEQDPMDRVMEMLDSAGISDDQIVGATISIQYVDGRNHLPTLGEADQETRMQSENNQPEPQAEVTTLNVTPVDDVPTVEYGKQPYAILKHTEQTTDEGEWVVPSELAETMEIPHSSVSSALKKFDDDGAVERTRRDDLDQVAYKYQITIRGREALRRSEHDEERRQAE